VSYVATGNGSLQIKTDTTLPNASPTGLTAGDFDGDGKPDLMIADQNGQHAYFMVGNGDGTFGAAAGGGSLQPSAVGTLIVGDWNGDKKLDLAGLGLGVGVSLGKGDGNLLSNSLTGASGSRNAQTFAAADFNGDGIADILVGGGSPSIAVLVGQGDGTFPTVVEFAAGLAPFGTAIGDFNRDGKLDLAVADQQVVNILLNTTP
jgi:hypothetical protein